jgi:uncharacterized protein YqhQ
MKPAKPEHGESLAVGGQALIEGVLIKAPERIAMAARNPQGRIITKSISSRAWAKRHPLLGLPVVRGAATLIEMVVMGSRALTWSAGVQGEEPSKGEMTFALVFSFGLAALLFILAPYYLSTLFFASRGIAFNLLDGIFRAAIFIAYLWLIGLLPDIKRTFMYHGAEHMAVHCREARRTLTRQNVRLFPPEHPRCGTSLLVFVIILSIILFSLIPSARWYLNIPIRLLLVPLIAGLAYEALKASARLPWLSFLSKPGIWVQKLTTRRPRGDQIEVAIAALNAATK